MGEPTAPPQEHTVPGPIPRDPPPPPGYVDPLAASPALAGLVEGDRAAKPGRGSRDEASEQPDERRPST